MDQHNEEGCLPSPQNLYRQLSYIQLNAELNPDAAPVSVFNDEVRMSSEARAALRQWTESLTPSGDTSLITQEPELR